MAYNPIGSNNKSGDGQLPTNVAVDRELFQQKAATDVLKYFMDTNVMKPLITTDSIENGKSKSFPVVGEATASAVTNDASELSIDSISATERIIAIGDLTVAHAWLTDLDNAMVHYDSKSAQIESIGRALAKKVDQDIITECIAAGNIVDSATAASYGLKPFDDDRYTQAIKDLAGQDISTGAGVYAYCHAAMTEFREKDAVGDPVFVLRPAQYFALLNNPAQTGLTWVNDEYAKSGKVPMVLGARVVYSPHFPTISTTPTEVNTYGILLAKEAVGMLQLLDISVRVDYIPQRLSNLMAGKYAVGYGVLNHACAVNMQTTVA